jgi:hypothetical protein
MSEESPKSKLTQLLFIICISIISIVAIDFINCNFSLPFSILNKQKEELTQVCKDSETSSYNTLIILLNTIIALKTKIDD